MKENVLKHNALEIIVAYIMYSSPSFAFRNIQSWSASAFVARSCGTELHLSCHGLCVVFIGKQEENLQAAGIVAKDYVSIRNSSRSL